MSSIYTVTVDGALRAVTVEYGTLEEAIRAWNRVSSANTGTTGGIGVQSFKAGLMVRDGWILHVRPHSTYLNPNLVTA